MRATRLQRSFAWERPRTLPNQRGDSHASDLRRDRGDSCLALRTIAPSSRCSPYAHCAGAFEKLHGSIRSLDGPGLARTYALVFSHFAGASGSAPVSLGAKDATAGSSTWRVASSR